MPYANIKNLRKERAWRQVDVAAFLNVSQNTYSQYESGSLDLSTKNLMKLAELYGVSVDYVLGRTTNPSVNQ